MKCPACRFQNSESAKFCNECGHKLIATPRAMPQPLSFNEKLSRIQRNFPPGLSDKIIIQRDRIEGERKHVAVMFCDMEGFTPLVEKLGPEAAYEIMDQVYEILIREVNDFEGTVNEMTGDGIMALFGAPIALEEAPQRALWSAHSIHREIAKFNDKKNGIGPIHMRIGIHYGPVVVGTLGNDLRIEFKAVGDTVNLASRMESMAEPEATYVTEEIFRLTRRFFRFKAIGKKAVKGKKAAVNVYKLLSARENIHRHRLGSERIIYSGMVGRSGELDQLVRQVKKLIKGAGSIVNIIGEAGVGKSRLVAELKKYDVLKEVTLFEGRAISMGRNLSFHPVIDLLQQWARIGASDSEAAAEKKLEAALRSLFPEQAGEMVPFLATLMGLKLSEKYKDRIKGIEGEALEKLILKNVRELLTRAGELTPLVIVIEDLHWVDTSTLELLESLFRLVETRRILWINLFRADDEASGHRIVQTIKENLSEHYIELVLEPLDERLSETLITNMLNIRGLHHSVIGQIVQRASGNPFFIEEVVRSFIDEGAVVLRNGKFEVTDKIGTMTIPNTINDVLMARIDRLEEKTRYLLKVASVIGKNFFYRILSEVASTIEDINAKLSYLKEIQLISERERKEELEYLFRHALAQEAAYESILPQRRKALHLMVARTIEMVFRDKLHEFYGMLAFHYSRAESPDKTEEFLVKAGEEALRSSASNEALHYYQDALGLYLKQYGDTADPERVAMLEKNIALALYNRGQYDEAVEHFDYALGYYWGKLPKNAISETFKFLSAFLHLLKTLYLPSLKFSKALTPGDAEVVDLCYKKCKALAIIDPKRFFLEFLYMYKGVTKFSLKKFELGLEIFMGASALFSFTGISFRLSRKILASAKDRVLNDDAKILIWFDLLDTIHCYLEGNWKAAASHNDEFVNICLNSGELYDAAQHLYWHGFIYIYQGSFDTAKSMVTKLNEIYEVYAHDLSISLKYELNTNLLMESRKLTDALIEVKKGIDFAEKAGLSYFLLEMYSCQAWVHILMGDIEDAEKSLKRANKIRQEVDSPVPFQLSNFYRSQLAYDLYRLSQAIKDGNKSESSKYRKQAGKSGKMLLKVAKKAAQHRTESYKLSGVYCWLNNNQGKALTWWHKAIEEGQRLGARLELSMVYHEVGNRLLGAESKYKMLDGITAEEYLERASVMFAEMGLRWDN
jgi:class 3 adenylate cyclase/tetratricopeptide (TPR) repeat protein